MWSVKVLGEGVCGFTTEMRVEGAELRGVMRSQQERSSPVLADGAL